MRRSSCRAAFQIIEEIVPLRTKPLLQGISRSSGFSLLEMLVVMGIIVLVSVLAIPAIQNVEGGRQLARAGNNITGILEQARAYAMANNTYVWVGLGDEPNDALAVGVVASRTGWANPVNTVVASPTSDLVQLEGIKRFQNIKLVALPETAPHRKPNDGVAQMAQGATPILSFTVGSGGNAKVFDSRVIQFNSRGECRISAQLFKAVEIGLQAATNSQVRNANNYVAVQIGGLSGSVTIYRP